VLVLVLATTDADADAKHQTHMAALTDSTFSFPFSRPIPAPAEVHFISAQDLRPKNRTPPPPASLLCGEVGQNEVDEGSQTDRR